MYVAERWMKHRGRNKGEGGSAKTKKLLIDDPLSSNGGEAHLLHIPQTATLLLLQLL